MEDIKCVECGSTNLIRKGSYYGRKGDKKQYQCKDCRRFFLGPLKIKEEA